ncbi:hypothetical protein EXIGLDRAFT_728768 [Exidia glandulosa HHB12029]|uniref:Uncharacterized protein n=1 Tax=Exidia glandulosa HHB12029 TaxID=1314781 RepID=A0A165CVU6_EXIGL|nr:hypothetical protein EXIGLDRAFT_728768 [Exidia glandulosa HHB12029]
MNVTTLTDVFLAGHFRGLLYTACKLFVHQDDYAHLDFAYMVHHCNILRENWWSQEFLPPFMANAQEPADLKWFATRTVGPLTTPRNACTKPCCF